jgi:hypothetical protein
MLTKAKAIKFLVYKSSHILTTSSASASSSEKKNKKTGINYLDELSPQERTQVFKQAKEHWNSLTVEQRTEHLAEYYKAIREKKRADGGRLMNVPDIDVVREILNVDMPKQKQAAIEEAERNGRPDIAEDLRHKRLGVDLIEIRLFDESTGKEIV